MNKMIIAVLVILVVGCGTKEEIISGLPAKGEIKELVVLLSNSPSYQCREYSDIENDFVNVSSIEILKGNAEHYALSLKYVENFFNSEAFRITGRTDLFTLNLNVVGPFNYDVNTLVSTLNYNSVPGIKANESAIPYLEGIATANGIDLAGFEVKAYAILMNEDELTTILQGKEGEVYPFPLGNAFPSMHSSIQYAMYDTCPYYKDRFSFADLATTVAHETLHVFGASDKYRSFENLDTSYVPPGKFSIMGDGIHPLTDQAISDDSAGEIGWKDNNGNGVLDILETN